MNFLAKAGSLFNKVKSVATIGNIEKAVNTIGQVKKVADTVGDFRGVTNYDDVSTALENVGNRFQGIQNAWDQRDVRRQYSGANYGPSLYSQPEFNLRSNPYQNTGFGQNRSQLQNTIKPTIRRSNFDPIVQTDRYTQGFQSINYDLPQQRRQELQPFNGNNIFDNQYAVVKQQPFGRNFRQDDYEEPQPYKQLKYLSYRNEDENDNDNQDYQQNDYTNQQQYEDEDEYED